MDVHDKKTRSKNMRAIKSRDTQPEIILRKAIHKKGLRYRICPADVPGKPDLYFPKYNAAIFVHGCFWHVHSCEYFRLPATRTEFWREKLNGNVGRDKKVLEALQKKGIRVLIVWECALKGKKRLPENMPALLAVTWLKSGVAAGVIDQRGLTNKSSATKMSEDLKIIQPC
ncbi:DNA mismatch endonuclease Vsr [Vibrio parahaemolyticus]|uniref:very short patch repair endonuclease n=1 Tax=Vibrio parahaemolyticus TaxID=670 RepID=UPI00111DB6EE|nr:DNA mismatch endonuclease Vsr [Vibrio parahaemolyticus]MDS1866221.1 DNA mismatch endonuclease Vsr [Vibrio parahaemolyticus]QUD91391.1 DNA mismatch endonuclease Vsr [Vibrio parahaemolyticus]TOJ10753.1 very short patch repair endonuclease [Vibrio parahaemolyticus]HCG5932906.1 DNA mismatch endonuclease Vsr [Vibrio parahaemolyticus]HCG7061673.1 DNA mismatch endonuclease Vsr [Vibrio parahaemolyticus]